MFTSFKFSIPDYLCGLQKVPLFLARISSQERRERVEKQSRTRSSTLEYVSSDWIAAYNIFVSICMYRFFSESDCRMRETKNVKWMRTEAKVYMYTSSIFTDIHVASVRVSRRGWVRLSSRTIHSNCTDIALNLKPTAVRVIEIVNDFTQMTRGLGN